MKKTVTLNPGESKVVDFTFTPTVARGYQANVDGLTGSFVAVPVPEAEFVVNNLIITPTDPYVGEEVSISVVVTNIGTAAGSYEVTCEVI
ncbi:hypothetical protein ES703_124853 [subsurface metagenome]